MPGHEGSECPYDEHKSGKEDGFAPVFLEKCVRSQIFFFQPPNIFAIDPLPHDVADPVVDSVSQNSGKRLGER